MRTRPTNGNTIKPDKSDGGDSDKEDGNSDKDMDDTPVQPPALSPQAITNNNIYWLSGNLIQSFFRWYWTELGDMTDFQNWLDKIMGMFKSLDEAIISLRYYPVDESFFGGVSSASSITLANTHYGEGLNAQKVNKTTPNIVTIGSYTIREYYKSFCDYSPYTQIKLYLPLHGWIDLDTNLFMGTKLVVKAAFDIMSSTIQYFIFANTFGQMSLGHFNSYFDNGNEYAGKQVSRKFNNTLRENGYTKVETNFFNHRPSIFKLTN